MAILFERLNTGDDGVDETHGLEWDGQVITPLVSHRITSVKLKLWRQGLPGIMTVAIRNTTVAGLPTGGDLCSGNYDADTLTTNASGDWYEIFLGSGTVLVAGTQVGIIWRAPSGNILNRVLFRNRTGDPYGGGKWVYSGTGGASWSFFPTTQDVLFEDWGVLPTHPTVTTNPATGILDTQATLNGTLDDDGCEACDCGFEWGLTTLYGNTTPLQSKTIGQTFAQTITGLSPNKTYHFRSFATNSYGTRYGVDQTFTTLVAVPSVITYPITGLGASQVIFNGLLSDDGGEACDCWFQWGKSPTLDNETITQLKTAGQDFRSVLLGLYPNTTYYYRAAVTNSVGTVYGEILSFTAKTTRGRAHAFSREVL